MPALGPVASLGPGATHHWELVYDANNTFLPPTVIMVRPQPLDVGFAGVFFQVSNQRFSIKNGGGGSAAYSLLLDVTNVATLGNAIFYRLVIGTPD
jgi:hypothetical protein